MTSYQILLAEDYPLNQKLVGTLLQMMGCEVLLANNGEEAVALFQSHKKTIDAILMDIKMPLMDGLQATRKIRSSQYGAQIPIIALTANAVEGDREHCLDAGMTDYLTKPIGRAALETALMLHLAHKSVSAEAT
ncbi:MAG: response regulator [Alphaproteobacteria bacterium]